MSTQTGLSLVGYSGDLFTFGGGTGHCIVDDLLFQNTLICKYQQ